jgi:hypothetical protein
MKGTSLLVDRKSQGYGGAGHTKADDVTVWSRGANHWRVSFKHHPSACAPISPGSINNRSGKRPDTERTESLAHSPSGAESHLPSLIR